MDKSFGCADPSVIRYSENTFAPEDSVLREVRARSRAVGLPQIHVGPMDGLHLEVLTRSFGVRRAVEIGTLAGYSGVCIARGLRPGGKLYTLEADTKHAEFARETFEKAGVSERVEVLKGPALTSLPKIEQHGPFDLVFVDADKVNYPNYLRWAAQHLRVGGVLLADNTFAFGMIGTEPSQIADEEDRATVDALREFNRLASSGGRFRATVLPTGEGLTMAVKL